MALLRLEKVYDRIDRNGLWQVLRIYGVGGNLLRSLQSRDSVSSLLQIWGWVMSLWLFDMDGAVRDVNERVLGRRVDLLGQ